MSLPGNVIPCVPPRHHAQCPLFKKLVTANDIELITLVCTDFTPVFCYLCPMKKQISAPDTFTPFSPSTIIKIKACETFHLLGLLLLQMQCPHQQSSWWTPLKEVCPPLLESCQSHSAPAVEMTAQRQFSCFGLADDDFLQANDIGSAHMRRPTKLLYYNTICASLSTIPL